MHRKGVPFMRTPLIESHMANVTDPIMKQAFDYMQDHIAPPWQTRELPGTLDPWRAEQNTSTREPKRKTPGGLPSVGGLRCYSDLAFGPRGDESVALKSKPDRIATQVR